MCNITVGHRSYHGSGYIHTHIHKYTDFLIVTICVGLAQARPNYYTNILFFHKQSTCTCMFLQDVNGCGIGPTQSYLSRPSKKRK